jgi:hypothetical protein
MLKGVLGVFVALGSALPVMITGRDQESGTNRFGYDSRAHRAVNKHERRVYAQATT